ncbi:MAG: DUF1553 domain-containing protein [Verrucomicrobiales bacterium]
MRHSKAWLCGLWIFVSATQGASDWWSLLPLSRPAIPTPLDDLPRAENAIDTFIQAKLAASGLKPAPLAEPRILIRRLYFDLIGLPPTPQEADDFVQSASIHRSASFEQLVDRLLASPHYGERWARHWLDVVHFGETHGYDKDKPRPNAWPYRDYVIRAFNQDKPFARFVQEQIAGDVLFPGTEDGAVATGFIAAGPWDFIGHVEVPETKVDGKIARHLDRDDMVSNTINTFCSLTIHCAQCHNHKFDPITQRDYYRLQAVFAALDRADRTYDLDPAVAARRASLETKRAAIVAENSKRPEFGWHSAISEKQDVPKWVQLDLGRSEVIEKVVLQPCHDDFGGIGDGFGFPGRFKVEVSNDPSFTAAIQVAGDFTSADVANPGIKPFEIRMAPRPARHLRMTATKLAHRTGDYIFALAEMQVMAQSGKNVAAGATVSAIDSIEAPPRWGKKNLIDGLYPHGSSAALDAVNAELTGLPQPRVIYSGCVHHGSGTFRGRGPEGGRPRKIFVLQRGDVRHPLEEAGPGTIPLWPGDNGLFDLPFNAPEGERRVALARWIIDPRHPLTWRSIVNRVWQYHFGRGIVDTPNDFGRMGGLPTHPELLDWLACWFRDEAEGSLKKLHRLIVTSHTYCQSSSHLAANPQSSDAENRLLWRQNRRKLEAEALRDSVLAVAGTLNPLMGGPSFQDFVVEKAEHSPHYDYERADFANPALMRRSIYRFIVRSQQQPWMATMDCADPSMLVDKRNETISPLQALAQLNNQLILVMSKHFAARLAQSGGDISKQMARAVQLALLRDANPDELDALVAYATRHGMTNACRIILNLNEFIFVD